MRLLSVMTVFLCNYYTFYDRGIIMMILRGGFIHATEGVGGKCTARQWKITSFQFSSKYMFFCVQQRKDTHEGV